MVWDVALGVIIGGLVLGLFRWAGEADPEFPKDADKERVYIALAIRAMIAAVAVAVSIWIGFKVHW